MHGKEILLPPEKLQVCANLVFCMTWRNEWYFLVCLHISTAKYLHWVKWKSIQNLLLYQFVLKVLAAVCGMTTYNFLKSILSSTNWPLSIVVCSVTGYYFLWHNTRLKYFIVHWFNMVELHWLPTEAYLLHI